MQLPQLQQYATLHKNDPYIVTLALSIANQKKQMKAGQEGQAGMQPQPKVVDQDIAQMLAPPPQQMLPEDTGIGQLPAQNMQNMAEGGIVAFDDGGRVPGYADGVFTGLKKKYKELQGYDFEGGPEEPTKDIGNCSWKGTKQWRIRRRQVGPRRSKDQSHGVGQARRQVGPRRTEMHQLRVETGFTG
jgi:hypothetical protein